MSNLTTILQQLRHDDPNAAKELLPLVYSELREVAAAKLAKERPGQTLDATALVHEAYLKLVGTENDHNWNSRGHFFAAAAQAMRRILVDNARRKQTEKHGGDFVRQTIEDLASSWPDEDLISLDEALSRLAEEDPIAAKVVELRFFAGIGHADIAKTLEITVYKARQKWTYARAWLRNAIED